MLRSACDPCLYLSWNLTPGVTFTRAGSDVSIASIMESAADEATLQSIIRLIGLGAVFIGCIVKASPHITHILSLGILPCMVVKGARSKWTRSVTLIHGRHPGNAIRRRYDVNGACGAWIHEMRSILCNAGVLGTCVASNPNAVPSMTICDESLSVLAVGGGASSFRSRPAVQGVIVRTHRFHHGGGSIRLCDGSGFIDAKFVQSAALRFSGVVAKEVMPRASS
jgi:hypothetical protein